MNSDLLSLNPHVREALHSGHPVVALESTIITHGMPYPANLETALQVEETIRAQGALPATLALLDGKMVAGLTSDQIERLARTGPQAVKTSRRDIPLVLHQRLTGATTVAATMIIARLAGIRLFATGGIGGVHRGATATMDISADLQELAQTDVGVVCAGAKSILDLPLTLEYLETHGVPVIGYQTREFPAFFTRSSGLPLDHEARSAEEIAAMLHLKWSIPLPGGVVIANPIPANWEPDFQDLQQATEEALRLATQAGVQGKAITPFLLATIERLTKGASLRANVQLVLNNARLAAQIAGAYARLAAG